MVIPLTDKLVQNIRRLVEPGIVFGSETPKNY